MKLKLIQIRDNMMVTGNGIGGAIIRAPFKIRTTDVAISMPATRRQFMNMVDNKIGYYKSTMLAVTDLIIEKYGKVK